MQRQLCIERLAIAAAARALARCRAISIFRFTHIGLLRNVTISRPRLANGHKTDSKSKSAALMFRTAIASRSRMNHPVAIDYRAGDFAAIIYNRLLRLGQLAS